MGGDVWGCLSSNPQSTSPTLGVLSGCPEKWSFSHSHTQSFSWDGQGVWPSLLHLLFTAWGRSQVPVSTAPSALTHWDRAKEGQLGELMLCTRGDVAITESPTCSRGSVPNTSRPGRTCVQKNFNWILSESTAEKFIMRSPPHYVSQFYSGVDSVQNHF